MVLCGTPYIYVWGTCHSFSLVTCRFFVKKSFLLIYALTGDRFTAAAHRARPGRCERRPRCRSRSALPPSYCPVLHIPGDKSPSQPPYCPESHIPGDNGAPATPHAPCRHAGSRRAPRQQPRARYSVRSAVTGSFLAAMRLGASPARNESPTEISTSTAPAATGTEARFSTPVIW